jgi:hypothetical protein
MLGYFLAAVQICSCKYIQIPEQLPDLCGLAGFGFAVPTQNRSESGAIVTRCFRMDRIWTVLADLWNTWQNYNWGNSITGCLVITAGLANTSFVGIPIIQALYGEEGVQIALLIDQAGSFIIVSSVAVIVASIYSVEKKRKRDISRKILTFPPFMFFLIAIGLNVFEVEIGENLRFFPSTHHPHFDAGSIDFCGITGKNEL